MLLAPCLASSSYLGPAQGKALYILFHFGFGLTAAIAQQLKNTHRFDSNRRHSGLLHTDRSRHSASQGRNATAPEEGHQGQADCQAVPEKRGNGSSFWLRPLSFHPAISSCSAPGSFTRTARPRMREARVWRARARCNCGLTNFAVFVTEQNVQRQGVHHGDSLVC